jgi:hypothetical protein
MLANRFGHWWEPHYHYNVAITALLVAAAADGTARIASWVRRPAETARVRRPAYAWAVAALVATVAVLPHFAFGRLFDGSFYHRDARARAAAAVLPAVPDGVVVEAANDVGPMLTARADVLLWDTRPRWAPWVVAETGAPAFPFGGSVADQRARVDLLRRSGYSVVRQQGGYVVLHRPGSVPDLR